MPTKNKRIKTINLNAEKGAFSAIFKRFRGEAKPLSDVSLVRSLLSNEKAKLLHILRQKQPNSIYELAKLAQRDFKAVRNDVKLLEKIGIIEMIPIHKGKREKLKPLLVLDILEIKFEL
jgi:predicted transcriptional regulator